MNELRLETFLAKESFFDRDLDGKPCQANGGVGEGDFARFGAGGWQNTAVEKALPVDMEVRDKEKRPDIAIAFVIDKSGSMGTGAGPEGGTKLDVAKAAAVAVSFGAAAATPENRMAIAPAHADTRRSIQAQHSI